MKIRKRIGAFLIDMFIVMMLSVTLANLDYLNPYKEKYQEASKNYEQVLIDFENTLGDKNSLDDTKEILNYLTETIMPSLIKLEKSNIFNLLWYLIIFFLYNVIFVFFNEGQSIGKKIFRLKVVNKSDDKVTLPRLIIRSLFNGSSLFLGINIILIIRILCTFINNTSIVIPVYLSLQLLSTVIEVSFLITLLASKGSKITNDLIARTEVIDIK